MVEGQVVKREIRIIYPRNNGPHYSTEEAGTYQTMNLSQHGIRLDCIRIGSSFQRNLDEIRNIRETDPDLYRSLVTSLVNFYAIKRAFAKNTELDQRIEKGSIKQLQEDYERLKIQGELYLFSNPNNPLYLEGIIVGWHNDKPQVALRISDENTIDEAVFKREALHAIKAKGYLTGTDGRQMSRDDLERYLFPPL